MSRRKAASEISAEESVAGKKAANKVAAKKSAAKKSAAKKTPAKKMAAKHAGHTGRDMRRAYEHMGRLESLRPLLAKDVAGDIEPLLRFAQGSLTAGDDKSAAELLRAGEHLAFGSLAAPGHDSSAGEQVREAAEAELAHLLERAEERWEEHEHDRAWPLGPLYKQTLRVAEEAGRQGALRRALEYARAADALAHVQAAPIALEAGQDPKQLRGR